MPAGIMGAVVWPHVAAPDDGFSYGSCCLSSCLTSWTPACLRQTRGEMSSSVLCAAGSGCTGIARSISGQPLPPYPRPTPPPPPDTDHLPDPNRLQGLHCSSGPLILPLSGHWKDLSSSCQIYFVSRRTHIYVYIIVGYVLLLSQAKASFNHLLGIVLNLHQNKFSLRIVGDSQCSCGKGKSPGAAFAPR